MIFKTPSATLTSAEDGGIVILILTRTEAREDGVFGILKDADGKQLAVTLEHAYDSGHGDGSYAPKMSLGVYKCVRGTHRLHDNKPFQTFEITKVPGHTNILFHVGNYNNDSDGCVLLGDHFGGDPRMIAMSRMTFEAFMARLKDINEFTLEVKNA